MNIRDFIYDSAPFALLDFTVIGGKFGLIPSVPYYTDSNAGGNDEQRSGHINHNAVPGDPTFEIRALFTDGNMLNGKCHSLSQKRGRCLPRKCFIERRRKSMASLRVKP